LQFSDKMIRISIWSLNFHKMQIFSPQILHYLDENCPTRKRFSDIFLTAPNLGGGAGAFAPPFLSNPCYHAAAGNAWIVIRLQRSQEDGTRSCLRCRSVLKSPVRPPVMTGRPACHRIRHCGACGTVAVSSVWQARPVLTRCPPAADPPKSWSVVHHCPSERVTTTCCPS